MKPFKPSKPRPVEHQIQISRFLGLPHGPKDLEDSERQRVYAEFRKWHHDLQVQADLERKNENNKRRRELRAARKKEAPPTQEP
jgi:hypothetical protein